MLKRCLANRCMNDADDFVLVARQAETEVWRSPMSFRPWRRPVDFFARRVHFVDHMLPIWEAMDLNDRGKFYVPEIIAEYAFNKGITDVVPLKPTTSLNAIACAPAGTGPLLVSAYGDLQMAKRAVPQRP